MQIAVLNALRDRLRDDVYIAAYLAERYPDGPVPKFFIGAKLRPAADEFPYFAVAPMGESKDPRPATTRTLFVAIQFGVNDDRVDEGVSAGIESVLALSELIYQALARAPSLSRDPAAVWAGEARMGSDMGVSHPYYEGEIVLTIQVRA